MARVEDPRGLEAEALRRLVDFGGKKVIDIGCGEGRTTMYIARSAASVLGLDPEEEKIARARSAAGSEENGITFVAANVVTLDLSSVDVDVVVFSRSL